MYLHMHVEQSVVYDVICSYLSSELVPDGLVGLESECGQRSSLRDTHVTAANHLQDITHGHYS